MKKINYKELETFKYFLMCYFNSSTYYSELHQVIDKFNNAEPEINRLKLLNELKLVQVEVNIQNLKDFVRIHGMRNMSDVKIKWFIDYLHENIKK